MQVVINYRLKHEVQKKVMVVCNYQTNRFNMAYVIIDHHKFRHLNFKYLNNILNKVKINYLRNIVI